jgi:hypothetical protein
LTKQNSAGRTQRNHRPRAPQLLSPSNLTPAYVGLASTYISRAPLHGECELLSIRALLQKSMAARRSRSHGVRCITRATPTWAINSGSFLLRTTPVYFIASLSLSFILLLRPGFPSAMSGRFACTDVIEVSRSDTCTAFGAFAGDERRQHSLDHAEISDATCLTAPCMPLSVVKSRSIVLIEDVAAKMLDCRRAFGLA